MSGERRWAQCLACENYCWHRARGLCSRCYGRLAYHGTLDQFPRSTRPIRDLAEDFDFLRRQGYTRTLAAERLGVPKKTLEKALERAARMQQQVAS